MYIRQEMIILNHKLKEKTLLLQTRCQMLKNGVNCNLTKSQKILIIMLYYKNT